MLITRRQLLKSSLLVVPAATAMPLFLRQAVASAAADGAATGGRTLVVVQMAGGNDGLNTVIPAADERYYGLRGSLAIPDVSVLPLDKTHALHPSMTGLKDLWDEGHVAIVDGVGYPQPNLSHFRSMQIWQTADPSVQVRDGWLGRYLSGVTDIHQAIFPGIATEASLPPELATGAVEVPVVHSVAAYRTQQDPHHPLFAAARGKALMDAFSATPAATPWSALLDTTFEAALRSSAAIAQADQAYQPAVTYPDSSFAAGLQLVAEVITADLGVLVAHVQIGSFDTHAGQLDQQAALLQELSDGIHAFYRDLQAHHRDANVLLMTWSEFGRRANANASGGTDHGTAGPQFVVGTPVLGGFYGEQPNLGDLDSNNLRFTIDFRSVYATVLEGWLGAPAATILGSRFETLPFLMT